MTRLITLDEVNFDRKLLINLTKLFEQESGTCLLYSGSQYDSAKYSFLCLFPFDFIWIYRQKQWRTNNEPSSRQVLFLDNPWDGLKKLLPCPSHNLPYPEWVGFLGYEMGAYSDEEKVLPCYLQAPG